MRQDALFIFQKWIITFQNYSLLGSFCEQACFSCVCLFLFSFSFLPLCYHHYYFISNVTSLCAGRQTAPGVQQCWLTVVSFGSHSLMPSERGCDSICVGCETGMLAELDICVFSDATADLPRPAFTDDTTCHHSAHLTCLRGEWALYIWWNHYWFAYKQTCQ